MATDTDKLVLSISADVAQMSRALKRMETETNRSTKNVEKQFSDMGKNVDRSVSKLGSSITSTFKNFGTGLVGGLAGAFGAQQFVKFADGATRITNALKVAGLEGKNLTDTYERLGKIALANGASFEAVATLYAKVSANAKQLGINSKQAEEFTRRIAVGLRASGTDAQAASAGILQLNQALASGVLRGDEFNSVAENLPVVAKAIADGLGVTVGELRAMAAEGELDAKTVFDAFIKGSEGLDAVASKTSTTFSQAFENISTALTIAAGEFNQTTGASQAFADIVSRVVAPAIISLGEAVAETTEKHSQLARELQGFAQSTGIEQGVLGAIETLKELTRAADPLVQAFQNAQEQIRTLRTSLAGDLSGIVGDFDAAMQSLRENGQEGVAAGIEAEFERLNQKIKDGTFTVQDFDTVIAKLADTGNVAADKLAGQLEIIQAKFLSAGEVAKKSFDEAGKALADAFGTNAISIINTLIDKIGNALPASVRNFGNALKSAAALTPDQIANAPTVALPGEVSATPERRVDPYFADPEGGAAKAGKKAGESMVTEFIKRYEGFISKAKWDVNAHRVGFGSDTMTSEAGRVSRVTASSVTSLEAANRDLARRIAEFQAAITSTIGSQTWASFNEEQKTALTSIAYNYGELPDRIVKAIEGGNPEQIGTAIRDLGDDNGGINRKRRGAEADLFFSGSGSGDTPGELAAEAQKQAVDNLSKSYDALGQIATTALNGIATALADGKIEGEELLQILFQIVQQILTMPRAPGQGGGLLGGLFGGGGGAGGGAAGGLLGGLIIPGILHKGGTVGTDGYGHGKAYSASTFAGAPRLHKGLMPDEFPAILQRGETVVPRGGFQGGGQQQTQISVGVSVDDDGKLQAYVRDVSTKQAQDVSKAHIAVYDRNLDRSFGGRMANAQQRQL